MSAVADKKKGLAKTRIPIVVAPSARLNSGNHAVNGRTRLRRRCDGDTGYGGPLQSPAVGGLIQLPLGLKGLG